MPMSIGGGRHGTGSNNEQVGGATPTSNASQEANRCHNTRNPRGTIAPRMRVF